MQPKVEKSLEEVTLLALQKGELSLQAQQYEEEVLEAGRVAREGEHQLEEEEEMVLVLLEEVQQLVKVEEEMELRQGEI
jgi:hypothetical protein